MPEIGETSIEQNQHLEVIEVLEGIMEAIRANVEPALPPVVNVDVEPSKVVVERPLTPSPSYRFTIERDKQGRIDNIIAEPMNG